jgi:hypothetical protein
LRFSVEEKNGTRKYRNPKACKNCPLKQQCTVSVYRTVSRHKYAEHAEQNDKDFAQHYDIYRLRQLLCEHPFGTVKRTMGIRQFLTRGLVNVSAEAALIFLCYNLKRLRNINQSDAGNTVEPSQFFDHYALFVFFIHSALQKCNMQKNNALCII